LRPGKKKDLLCIQMLELYLFMLPRELVALCEEYAIWWDKNGIKIGYHSSLDETWIRFDGDTTILKAQTSDLSFNIQLDELSRTLKTGVWVRKFGFLDCDYGLALHNCDLYIRTQTNKWNHIQQQCLAMCDNYALLKGHGSLEVWKQEQNEFTKVNTLEKTRFYPVSSGMYWKVPFYGACFVTSAIIATNINESSVTLWNIETSELESISEFKGKVDNLLSLNQKTGLWALVSKNGSIYTFVKGQQKQEHILKNIEVDNVYSMYQLETDEILIEIYNIQNPMYLLSKYEEQVIDVGCDYLKQLKNRNIIRFDTTHIYLHEYHFTKASRQLPNSLPDTTEKTPCKRRKTSKRLRSD